MNSDSDPGEGTSDGRVKRNQLKPKVDESDIKEEIVIKDEPDDIEIFSPQKLTIESNDAIKSESDSENEVDYLNEEVKLEEECKKKKVVSKKDESSVDHQAGKNPHAHEPKPNKNVKKHVQNAKKKKQQNEQQKTNVKTSKKLPESGYKKMHKCDLCNYETSRKGNLTRHNQSHASERSFECEVCAKSFTQKSYLKRHQLTHRDQFPFHCLKCRIGFANEIDKVKHENKCNCRQYECHLCKYSCQESTHLRRHMQSQHTGEKLFECCICPKVFVTNFELGCHSRKHIKQLPYDCSKCGQRFVGETLKQLHEQRCASRRYECYACRYKCHIRQQLKVHMKYRHTGDEQFQCSICQMKFVEKCNLNNHLAIHAKKRPIRCSKCLLKFTQNDEREQHEKHCNRRHYKCFMCGSTSQRLIALKNHIRAHHTGEKPFQCKVCYARFPSKIHFNKHMNGKHIATN